MLKIRQQREDRHKRIVADRLRQITTVREQLVALEHQVVDETDAIRKGQSPGTIDLQQAIRHRSWLAHLHKAILDGQARWRFLEARLVQERAALTEAAKQRRILEKLKERQYLRYRQEEEKIETREADDQATIRYVFDRSRERQLVESS